MQIQPPTSPALQALAPAATATSGGQGSANQAGATAKPAELQKTPGVDSKDVDAGEGERVTLSTKGSDEGQHAPELAPVYAEIWKEGVKVAVVDTHGGVVGLNGFVAPAEGTAGAGGAELAARRAAMIAHTVGGEIRTGGQVLDSQTLAMRTRLKAAYGS